MQIHFQTACNLDNIENIVKIPKKSVAKPFQTFTSSILRTKSKDDKVETLRSSMEVDKHQIDSDKSEQLEPDKAQGTHRLYGQGFINQQSNCYLNSTIQSLYHIPVLANWLLRFNKKDHTLCEVYGTYTNCIILFKL